MLVLAAASVALVQCAIATPSPEQNQCVIEAAENQPDTVNDGCGVSGNVTICLGASSGFFKLGIRIEFKKKKRNAVDESEVVSL